jgi:anti-sigma B factor antagonist
MLNITTKREGENLLVRLDGQLDRLTAPQLYDTLTANLDGVKNLTLDFEKLDYTSSAGLRVLLATEKEIGKKGRMEIIHVNEMIMDAFEVTGLVDIFNIV